MPDRELDTINTCAFFAEITPGALNGEIGTPEYIQKCENIARAIDDLGCALDGFLTISGLVEIKIYGRQGAING
jgi:hypothetical protein